MIKLQEVLGLLDAQEVTIVIPVSPRLDARIETYLPDAAVVDDIVARYGERPIHELVLDKRACKLIITLN